MTDTGRALLRVVLRRLAGALVVLWAAVTVTFVGLRAMPGSVEDVVLGVHANDPGLREQVRDALGLDRPVLVQYLDFLAGLARGDLGRSYVQRTDVADLIGSQIGPTVQLAVAALLIAGVTAWLVAVLTADRPPASLRLLSAVEMLAICVPTFWAGSLLLLLLSYRWGWFPAAGAGSPSALVLPALTLALPIGGILGQFLREEVARRQHDPFVLSARARGISPLRLRTVHLVPHAAVASLTLAGNMLGALIGGAVVVETVFGRPGLGRTALTAVQGKDMPVLLAVVLIVAAAYVLVSAVVDTAAVLIDPRLREVRR